MTLGFFLYCKYAVIEYSAIATYSIPCLRSLGAGLVTIPRMTLMASLSIYFATLHAHQALALMRQLANILVGFLFELEAYLAEKYLAFLLFIQSSIDAMRTSPERQIEPSPTTSFKVRIDQMTKNETSKKPSEIVPSTILPPIEIQLLEKRKATTKVGSVRDNHLHEFDTEGWLLVANPGTNHLVHKL
jgi:hypothetical protein